MGWHTRQLFAASVKLSISEAQHQLALHLKLVFVKKLRENPPDSFPDVRFSFPLGILRSFDQIGSR